MENMDFSAMLYNPVVFVAVIIGINEILKDNIIPKNYIPFVSLAIGILIALFLPYFWTFDIASRVFIGFIMGTTACGVFDTSKVFSGKETPSKKTKAKTTKSKVNTSNDTAVKQLADELLKYMKSKNEN